MLHPGKVQYCLQRTKPSVDRKGRNKDVRLICYANSEETSNQVTRPKRKTCCKALIQGSREDMSRNWGTKKKTSPGSTRLKSKSTGRSKPWRTDLTTPSMMKSNRSRWSGSWSMMKQAKVKDPHPSVATKMSKARMVKNWEKQND